MTSLRAATFFTSISIFFAGLAACQRSDSFVDDSGLAPTWQGRVDGINCDLIHGWAWDSSRPNSAVQVRILDNNAHVMTVVASDFREDLLAAHKGNGRHGFSVPMPDCVKDGRGHSISIKAANAEFELSNSPTLLTCPAIEQQKPSFRR